MSALPHGDPWPGAMAEVMAMLGDPDDLIGTFRRERLTCTTEHLPGCYNNALDRTWCICGGHQWEGATPTVWLQREIRRPLPGAVPTGGGVGRGAPGLPAREAIVGWDVYQLKTSSDPERRRER